MSMHFNDNGSIRAKGKDAQRLFDALTENLDPAKPPPSPTLSPNLVSQHFTTMSESAVSIRNAAKCSKIDASKKEILRLSDQAEEVGRILFTLATELRRTAR